MKNQQPSVFVKNSNEGEERVLQGDYAYFAESTTVEYKVERNCELTQIGNWLNSIGYGIALPKGKTPLITIRIFSTHKCFLADFK